MHRTFLVAPLLLLVPALSMACSDGGSGEGGAGAFDPGGRPLAAGPAPLALCAGAAKRGPAEGKQGGTGASTGSGASGAAGGSSWGAGGSGTAGGGGSSSGKGGPGPTAGSGGSGTAGTGSAGKAGGGGSGVAGSAAGSGGAAAGCAGSTSAGAAGATLEPCGEAGSGGGANVPPPPPPDGSVQACGNLDLSTPYTLYMSADDSNSMASPVIVRSLLRRHAPIPDGVVRTHEFLNYYHPLADRAPQGAFALSAKLGSCALSDDLPFAVSFLSPPPDGDRPEARITLVLDTSGSMEGAPLQREKAAIRALAKALRAGDVVGAVQWADSQTPLFANHVVSGPDDPKLLALADGLATGGGTNFSAGLAAGYKLAKAAHVPGKLSRVIVISDGIANAGITDENVIGQAADDQEAEGIYLVGVGVGDGVNDTLMNTVTDAGRGAYVYLDSDEEADRVLHQRFTETVLVGARDVQISVTLPPYFGIAQFSGETFDVDPKKVRPQHLAPDDAMVLYQLLHACDASLVRGHHEVTVAATWKDAKSGTPRKLSSTATLQSLADAAQDLTKVGAIVSYAAFVRDAAKLTPAVREARRAETLAAVAAAPQDAELEEIAELVALVH